MKTIKIYGPPGTGKTTTLISTLKKLLQRGYKPSEIAYLSHTNAAISEVKDRILQQFGSTYSEKDFLWFRTMHSASCRLLNIGGADIWSLNDTKQFAIETGWQCKGVSDMQTIVEEAGGETNYDVVLTARSNASHWMVPLDEAMRRMPNNGAFANAYKFLEAYEGYKDRDGKIDFTDMLEKVAGKGPLPVKIMLVDECQDLSKRQWTIIKEWSAECDFLFLAGDDDQSIYSFMGGDEYGFLDHPADDEKVLQVSYRCPETIGQVASNIIRRISKRHDKEVRWQDKMGSVKRIPDLDMIDWAKLATGDKSVMVLVRHRKQGGKISYSLLDRNVPHTTNGYSVTSGRLAENVATYLRMRRGDLCTIPRIADMFYAAGYKNLTRDARRLAADGQKTYGRDDFSTFPWDAADWHKLFVRSQKDQRPLATLRRIIAQYGVDIIGKPLNIDISTYHGSKGREADIVILLTDCYPVAWEEQIKNPDTEIRLCYVGITRAREQAIIVSPQTDMYMRALVEN